MRLFVRTLVLASVIGLPLLSLNAAAEQRKTSAKQTGKSRKAAASTGLKTPGEEFGKTKEAGANYENAGRAAVTGGKRFGSKSVDGNLVGGASDFGIGMGKMGKESAVGTAKVGAGVGRGVASVFSGGGKRSDTKTSAKKQK